MFKQKCLLNTSFKGPVSHRKYKYMFLYTSTQNAGKKNW